MGPNQRHVFHWRSLPRCIKIRCPAWSLGSRAGRPLYYDYEITRMRFRRRCCAVCAFDQKKKRIPEHVRESWPLPSPRSSCHGLSGHRKHASGTGRQTNSFPCLPYCVAARHGFRVSLLFASILPDFAGEVYFIREFMGSGIGSRLPVYVFKLRAGT